MEVNINNVIFILDWVNKYRFYLIIIFSIIVGIVILCSMTLAEYLKKWTIPTDEKSVRICKENMTAEWIRIERLKRLYKRPPKRRRDPDDDKYRKKKRSFWERLKRFMLKNLYGFAIYLLIIFFQRWG